MKCITHSNRVVYVITTDDLRKVGEARFKLAELNSSYGKSQNHHYWSLPTQHAITAERILRVIFEQTNPA